MSTTNDFDILTTTDKPALVGLSNPELLEASKAALEQLGYKVHIAINHGEFLHKFAQTQYQVVVLEDTFSCNSEEENEIPMPESGAARPSRRESNIEPASPLALRP